MENIKIGNLVEVQVDENALEPKDYFKILKTKLSKVDAKGLQNQLEVIAENILMTRRVNQTDILKRLSFTYKTIISEKVLCELGFDQFVYKDDIKTFIDKVKPANSIKIIELARYPRIIPQEGLKLVDDLMKKDLGLEFVIVFTDFTNQDYKTTEEKKMVERNRDPIIFGYFKDKETGIKHDRFYFVYDWEDDYCDLTFTKMIERMERVGIKNANHSLDDKRYLERLIGKETEKSLFEVGKDWFNRVFK